MTSDDYERVGRAVVGMLDAMATARNFGEAIDAMEDHLPRLKDSIPPDRRPRKDQPYYHLLAENAETEYIAYVSEQNLVADDSGAPLRHPQVKELFAKRSNGKYEALHLQQH